VGEFFGMERVGSILGALGTSFGLGAVIGPALAGVIFDVTRSYFTAFTIGASMSLLAALLIALIKG
ncbi:MAG: oxalate:formate antiporter, partial [Thermoprotei archaeon]